MLFSSYTFLFQFLPAVVLAFAAARLHSPRAGILVLVCASLLFYGAWRPVYLLLLIASIAANFCLGLLMEHPYRRRVVGMGSHRLTHQDTCSSRRAPDPLWSGDLLGIVLDKG